MKRKSKTVIIGVFFISICFFGLAVFATYNSITTPPPSLPPFQVWIPEGASLEADKDVNLGTFTFFSRSIDEIKALAKERPEQLIVVYPDQPLIEYQEDEFKTKLVYWLPRGNGTFYKATQAVPYKSSSSFSCVAIFDKEGRKFIYTPSKNWLSIVCVAIMLAICSAGVALIPIEELKKPNP